MTTGLGHASSPFIKQVDEAPPGSISRRSFSLIPEQQLQASNIESYLMHAPVHKAVILSKKSLHSQSIDKLYTPRTKMRAGGAAKIALYNTQDW